MKQSLNLKFSQQLTLTPQLRQSLRLLQLSSVDLEQEIQQSLESNPLLEREEDTERSDHEPSQVNEVTAAQDNNIPQPIAEAVDPSMEIERTDNLAPEQDLTGNWEESFESHRTVGKASSPSPTNGELSQTISKQETLFEHLSWQVQMTTLSEKDKLIALTILHCLDDEGYLGVELVEVEQMFDPNLMVDADEIQAVLSLIKTLEPIGVGARNLGERLLALLDQYPADTSGLSNAKLISS